MKLRRKLLLVFALLLSLGASGSALAQDKAPLRKVTLLIYSNVPDLGDAPYWMVPHAMGYFAEEGLQVEPVYAKGAGFAIQLLSSGKGDFALAVPDPAMSSRQKGVKVKSVFEGNRTYGSALVVPQSSGITKREQLKDYLKGGSIGVLSMTSGRIPYARAWIRELGLSDSDVNLVEVGVGAQAAVAVKTGRAKALVMYDAAYSAIEAASDVRFTRFETDWQQPFFSGVILAPDETIQKDPELIVHFTRAIAKALVFATTNPEAVVRIYWALYPENKPTADSEQTGLAKSVAIVRSMEPNWKKGMDKPGAKWGSQSADDWTKMQEFSASNGLIPGKLPVDEYFTNQFNDKANQFDAAAVRKQAETFTPAMIKYTASK
jgi:NitT/TauT family transport system substrate-binding protein